MKSIVWAFFLSCILSFASKAQNISHFFLYSYDHALFNPAAAGAENKHVIGLNGRFTYDQERWEDKTVPYTGMISYNGNISPINSGMGFFGVVDRFGIETTSKLGLSYNYKIKMAPKASLRIGARPTITKHTIDFSKYRFVDENDPTVNSGKETKTAVDLDLGLWFDVFGFYLGGTLTNVFKHNYEGTEYRVSGHGDEYSPQTLTIIAGKKIKIPGFQIDPSVAFLNQDDYYYLSLSNNFVFGNFFVLGGTYFQSMTDDHYNLSVNSGISIKNRVQLIGLLYTRNNNRPSNFDSMFFEGLIRVKI